MSDISSAFPSERWIQLLSESSRRSSLAHNQFLQQRRSSLGGLRSLIELQLRAQSGNAAAPGGSRPAVIDSAQLDAFGSGKLSDCLGSAFTHYDQRRIPRIPNGDLKMMSRVVSIDAEQHNFSRACEVVVEYDVPVDAWYFRDNPSGEIPYALFMEIALQPCGFLSAYLDTYALVPFGEFYFRNLDGAMRFHSSPALAGQTIVTRARMLSSVASSGTVIQKFAFSLFCQDQLLVEGESVFGYFVGRTMTNQLGLDGGKQVAPWHRPAEGATTGQLNLAALVSGEASRPAYRLAGGRMNMLEQATMEKSGGRYGKGYVYASRRNNPQDWYYPYHFYQDPVMPGSLGVEAMLQCLQIYALANDLGAGLRSPRFALTAGGQPMSWRYRGQVTQQHQLFEVEVQISDQRTTPEGVLLVGDASVWIDGLRIYEARNAAIRLLEA